ncbi:hypothetical protein B7486_42250 [cyanobacterium TDX16]|nr:hypothetical protein B7486_42250 [cyanobacterium TDX16]
MVLSSVFGVLCFLTRRWETKIPNRTDTSDASGPLQGRAVGSGRDRPEPKAENGVCLARPMQARTGGDSRERIGGGAIRK